MNIPHVPPDKALHYIWGSLAYLAVLLACTLLQAADARMLALGGTVLLAVGKELADWMANEAAQAHDQPAPHKVEFADAIATALGGLVCWVAGAL